jgi:hypothetical protein
LCRNVGFPFVNPTYKIGDRTGLATAIALSKAKEIAVLKFRQQDDGDRTFTSQNNRNFKSYRDRGFKV